MYQMYSIKGAKVIDGYESNNPLEIRGYDIKNFNIENSLIGSGIIYKISATTKMQANYFYKKYINKYNFHQYQMLLLLYF